MEAYSHDFSSFFWGWWKAYLSAGHSWVLDEAEEASVGSYRPLHRDVCLLALCSPALAAGVCGCDGEGHLSPVRRRRHRLWRRGHGGKAPAAPQKWVVTARSHAWLLLCFLPEAFSL